MVRARGADHPRDWAQPEIAVPKKVQPAKLPEEGADWYPIWPVAIAPPLAA